MKSTYNKQTNTIKELPEMEEPKASNHNFQQGSYGLKYYNECKNEYNNHIASLKEYTCHNSCKWVDGQVVEEGVDYHIISSNAFETICFPIPPQPVEGKGEDEKIKRLFIECFMDAYSNGMEERRHRFIETGNSDAPTIREMATTGAYDFLNQLKNIKC